jgi:hypothetical protein
MTLYAADIESLAKPVSVKGKGKKAKAQTETPPESVESASVGEPEKKAKKPPTEKQLAARAKFAENRKKKLEEQAAEKLRLEKEVEDKQKSIEAAEAAKEEKKKKRAEARVAKRKAAEIDVAVEEAVGDVAVEAPKEVKPKKQRVAKPKRDDSVPPVWFEKFVESAKLEESKIAADKKPVKQVREEAKAVAQTQWADGYTRDRVTDQVDQHMGRLYSMIFKK